MCTILIKAAICIYASLAASPQHIQKYMMTDQFGYRPGDEKVAFIIDPQDGYNESDEFIPGNTFQVRVWETDEVVFSGEPVDYNNAQTITAYGDRG